MPPKRIINTATETRAEQPRNATQRDCEKEIVEPGITLWVIWANRGAKSLGKCNCVGVGVVMSGMVTGSLRPSDRPC